MNEEKVVCPMSLDRLIEKIAELKNPTVAGLDPKLSYIPVSYTHLTLPTTSRV